MQPPALTNCTGLRMSKRQRIALKRQGTLIHASEVAHWVVVLLGWVWLGEQGMLLGWSMANGLLPVALWWAVRMLFRGSAWTFQCPPWLFGVMGLLTASGVWLLGLHPFTSLTNEGLLGLALVWGLWSALIETRTPHSTFQLGSIAWHPVVAGILVLAGWQMPDASSVTHLGALILLLMSAGVLYANEWYNSQRKESCQGLRTSVHSLLAPSAMGVMMGSLWLSNAWCVGLGWTTEHMLVFHLALMAGLPALVAYAIRSEKLTSVFYQHHFHFSLPLLTLGALALLGDHPIYSVLAMLLPSLSWALHCTRPRFRNETIEISPPWLVKILALFLGPVLLICVGILSPLQGPLAIQTALALVGVLALIQLLHLWWGKQFVHAHLSIQGKIEMPKL
jgi:hypothetical protein